MKLLYYFNKDNWFGGFCCPFCFKHMSASQLLYDEYVDNNAMISCNNCGEMLLCFSFANEINKGLTGETQHECNMQISKVKLLIKFFESIKRLKNDVDKLRNIKKTLISFIDNGYSFYETSVLKITKVRTYKNQDELLLEDVDTEYDIPDLLTFDKIFNFNIDIDLDEMSHIGYDGECTECHIKYSSTIVFDEF